jgi:hypothetical protein
MSTALEFALIARRVGVQRGSHVSIWLVVLFVWLVPALLIGLMLGWTIYRESRQATRQRSGGPLQAPVGDQAGSA